jgi:predicted DNA-binding transcriptional regulator YafY
VSLRNPRPEQGRGGCQNWCLRLDRITEAAIAPLKKENLSKESKDKHPHSKRKWFFGLDTIQAEIYLFQGLAFAYRTKKSKDEIDEWLTDLPSVRRIVRRVSNSFWFIREILRYGGDCEIISPPNLRERASEEIQAIYKKYKLNS